ncbi:hypothetical protein A4W93_21765 [Piscinibacter gummiphilus]|uniref:Uncharacterized protein n=1 Tax=Piscinibacter gummiphilus TaxID=946333 RepID=A0A1W6LDG0_9BURK|nr:hypothetical protein A4W93_21765 [Piscinibacter gummiphilus]ATU67008.1 hypothetical protein CPZ87_21890 [Piscinibacter gummiphilus]
MPDKVHLGNATRSIEHFEQCVVSVTSTDKQHLNAMKLMAAPSFALKLFGKGVEVRRLFAFS